MQLLKLTRWPFAGATLKQKPLLAATDLCVKCGLCLPECPTYQITLNENESPRGRISLIQGWASGDLKASSSLHRHIDNCLLCRSCESVCPAQVPYSKIIDEFRSLAGKGPQRAATKVTMLASRAILVNKEISRFASRFAAFARSSRLLAAISQKSHLARQLTTFLSDFQPHTRRKTFYPAPSTKKGCVGLFTGCTGELFDTETIEASIRLLGRLGFDVWLPPEQSCCGALDLHAGDTKKAGMLAAANVRAFDRPRLDWIVTLATGCGAMLKEYPAYFPQTEQLASKTVDICQLAREVIEDRQMALQPLNKTILLHAPCSLNNVLKTADAQKALVSSIPGATIETLDQVRCCGAAGSYMIEHPEMASALRDNILKIARATRPEYLLTPNIGCALHIKAGLKQIDMAIEVIHPIVLFERQLTSGRTV